MKRLFIIFFVFCLSSCSSSDFKSKWTQEKSPESFSARFETSKGDFDIEVTRRLSPQAADRMYQLIKHDYFDGVLFYRVVPDFVAQFGELDTTVTNNWKEHIILDEPVLKGNTKGAISFARSGKDSRHTQLFINLSDNSRLDTITYNDVTGFPAFGEVTQGMEVVESLFSGYGDTVMKVPDSISRNKQRFLGQFPKLDSIKSAKILRVKN